MSESVHDRLAGIIRAGGGVRTFCRVSVDLLRELLDEHTAEVARRERAEGELRRLRQASEIREQARETAARAIEEARR